MHEAFIRLIRSEELTWNDRSHFFALAAHAMRQVLVDYARRRRADKRGGAWQRVTLDEGTLAEDPCNVDLLLLDDVLSRFAREHERAARVVELRFFGGLSLPQVSTVLDVSRKTVAKDWAFARAWLSRALRQEESS